VGRLRPRPRAPDPSARALHALHACLLHACPHPPTPTHPHTATAHANLQQPHACPCMHAGRRSLLTHAQRPTKTSLRFMSLTDPSVLNDNPELYIRCGPRPTTRRRRCRCRGRSQRVLDPHRGPTLTTTQNTSAQGHPQQGQQHHHAHRLGHRHDQGQAPAGCARLQGLAGVCGGACMHACTRAQEKTPPLAAPQGTTTQHAAHALSPSMHHAMLALGLGTHAAWAART